MSYIKKSSKIFFFLILILLFFGLALVYNQSRELEAQEISLTCGEEIPLGEAIDGALALIGIEEEVITFFSASVTQIEAAKQLFELSGQCEAENCDANCRVTALAPDKTFASNFLLDRTSASYAYSESKGTLANYKLAQADKPTNLRIDSQSCRNDSKVNVVFAWDKIPGGPGDYIYTVWLWSADTGWKSGSSGVAGWHFWMGLPRGTNFTWYVEAFNIFTGDPSMTAWKNFSSEDCDDCPSSVCGGWKGDFAGEPNSRFYDLCPIISGVTDCPADGANYRLGTTCWYDKKEDCAAGCDAGECVVPGCNVSCVGDPCPSDIKDLDLIGQITDAFDKISDIKTILEEITITKDEVLAKLEKARKELAKCVTPAGAYDPERAVEEIKLLYTCQAAKYLRILTEEQEKCYINNFLCCYLK